MARNYGYIRVSTDRQDEANQRLAILEFAQSQKIMVDEFISVEVSSRKSQRARRIDELMESVKPGDTILVTELSRLARSTAELITMINDDFIKRRIGLMAIKQSLRVPPNGEELDPASKTIITMFALMGELERDFISVRTRMGLAAKKASGVRLGKPPGTIQSSKLDEKRSSIEELLKYGVAKSAIARMIGTSRSNLLVYLRTRSITQD